MSAANFISLHPELLSELAGHALAHSMYSHIRGGNKPGLSRHARRKAANTRRRWFVDNIVLHHKRLHDKNRELAVSRVRDQALAKRDALKKQSLSLQGLAPKKDEARKWRDRAEIKERSSSIRNRVDSRRLRARSRWMETAEATSAN
jgi:hypothetical protein